MTTMAFRPGNATASHAGPAHGIASASVNTNAARQGVPMTMSPDEIGYWTTKWRADEQESARARERGDSCVFDSDDPSDAVRWLLSDD